jgi:hypothetical protein
VTHQATALVILGTLLIFLHRALHSDEAPDSAVSPGSPRG